ncbi:hypothetical protein FXO38_35793 [Capsicum annuum]|uniref:F-box domain-containing protein n=1 Tax=Capsicum annuum TaxID=4072 RepID=A0A2G2YE17_CAPAN|nr:hypothetical protein FXO38_35793 [Capsicum annuum]KAF3653600.1 hypothetical protein FXO37_16885 [Capsicum annuum]PHT67811.1 hypothetical protein T459_27298 [Capsicum annuum]
MADSIIPILPHKFIIEILLKVPPKSLLKFMCVSKSWLQLISNPKFVETHLKLTSNDNECSNHRIMFQESTGNFITQLFDIDSPLENPTIYTWIVGSIDGLIYLYNKIEEPILWNSTIKKAKKLPTFGEKLRKDCSYYCKYGFGYDESHGDYKVVVIQCISEDDGSYETIVNIYSLKADSLRTINKFQGNFIRLYLLMLIRSICATSFLLIYQTRHEKGGASDQLRKRQLSFNSRSGGK